jgi:hypothetical protein
MKWWACSSNYRQVRVECSDIDVLSFEGICFFKWLLQWNCVCTSRFKGTVTGAVAPAPPQRRNVIDRFLFSRFASQKSHGVGLHVFLVLIAASIFWLPYPPPPPTKSDAVYRTQIKVYSWYISCNSGHACGSVLVKALCYNPNGHRFETRWGELIFSICLILPAALGHGVHPACNRNEYQKQKHNVSAE